MTALRRGAFQAVREPQGAGRRDLANGPVSSPGESPMQRSRGDGYAGLIDPWAHGQRPSTPFPLQ
jgi:hypothetical protein